MAKMNNKQAKEIKEVAELVGVKTVNQEEAIKAEIEKQEEDKGFVPDGMGTDADGFIPEDETDKSEDKDQSTKDEVPEEAEVSVDDEAIKNIIEGEAGKDLNILEKIEAVANLLPKEKGQVLLKSLLYLLDNRLKTSVSKAQVVNEQKSFVRYFRLLTDLPQTEFNYYYRYFNWAYTALNDLEQLATANIGPMRQLSPLDKLNIVQHVGETKDELQVSFVYIMVSLGNKLENPKLSISTKNVSVQGAITADQVEKINNFYN